MTAGRWLAGILVLCAVAGASFAVSSVISSRQCGSNAVCQMGQGLGVCVVTDYLDLTPEQERRVNAVMGDFCVAQQADGMRSQAVRQRLLAVLKSPKPKRGDLDAALRDLSVSQAELQRQTAEYLLELKPILTDDQEKKLFELVEDRFCRQGGCGLGAGRGRGAPACNMQPGCSR